MRQFLSVLGAARSRSGISSGVRLSGVAPHGGGPDPRFHGQEAGLCRCDAASQDVHRGGQQCPFRPQLRRAGGGIAPPLHQYGHRRRRRAGLDSGQGASRAGKPGDLVYMPVEYDLYSRPRERFLTGMDAAYRFRHDKASLLERGPEGMVRAALSCSACRHSGAIAQGRDGLARAPACAAASMSTPWTARATRLTGHDGAKAGCVPCRHPIRQEAAILPDTPNLLSNPDGSQAAIADFLDWCRTHKVAVIGGLPTVFDDKPVPDAAIARLETFYADRHGAQLLWCCPTAASIRAPIFTIPAITCASRRRMRHSRTSGRRRCGRCYRASGTAGRGGICPPAWATSLS